MRAWWGRRSRWAKIGLIVLAVVVVLTIAGALIPAEEESADPVAQGDTTPAAATNEEATTEEATTTEPATTEETTTEETATEESGDTGRMSDTEFERFSGAVAEVDDELGQFGTTLQRCGVLLQAFELAAASECVGEAYSGIEEDVGAALFVSDDLQDDVAKNCLKSLTAYEARLNRYANYVSSVHAAGENLQFAKFNRLAKRAVRESRAYANARDAAILDCAPA